MIDEVERERGDVEVMVAVRQHDEAGDFKGTELKDASARLGIKFGTVHTPVLRIEDE